MKGMYQQLSSGERFTIERLFKQGYSKAHIAKVLDRHKSTISREINRNWAGKKFHYNSSIAHNKAQDRLVNAHKRIRLKSPFLRKQVSELIQAGLSPQRISGRLKLENNGSSVISHTAIYNWIHSQALHLEPSLLRSDIRRYHRHSPLASKSHIPHRVPISQRPLGRLPGQWESDLIVSKASAPALQTCVERFSRFLTITKLPNKTATANRLALIKTLSPFKCTSITYDNGIENTQHLLVNQALHSQSFFCEPYHSWEKGSIENRNGIIRQYLPKSTDFNPISQNLLSKIQDSINHTPLKCLGYLSPAEVQFNKKLSIIDLRDFLFHPKSLHPIH